MAINPMPVSLDEAYHIFKEHTLIPFAGGTDLMVQKRSWSETLPKTEVPFLFLSKIAELTYIREEDSLLAIGAMTTLEAILDYPKTPQILKAMIKEMASPGIRHQATLAGNIGNASPAGDALLCLVLLDAQVVLGSLDCERVIPVDQYIIGPRKTVRKAEEIIIEIRIPLDGVPGMFLRKVGTRKSDAISKLSIGSLYWLQNDRIVDFRLAFGAVGPTIIRNREIEKSICQIPKKDILHHLPTIKHQVSEWIRPIDDQRSTQTYRKETALALLDALINEIHNI
ncbi:MAG: FAD binding domain-containing protein [Candidatus Izemoplasmatales bacterium]|nr:FAD binding domain-containing protein [Candidatus Izemoplasmatales bacterium]